MRVHRRGKFATLCDADVRRQKLTPRLQIGLLRLSLASGSGCQSVYTRGEVTWLFMVKVEELLPKPNPLVC